MESIVQLVKAVTLQKCLTCRFAKTMLDGNGRIMAGKYLCRRYPPTAAIGPDPRTGGAAILTVWPQMDKDDSCGEGLPDPTKETRQ